MWQICLDEKDPQCLELGAQSKLQTVSKPFKYWVSEPSFWYWGANWDYFLVSILVCPNHHPYCCRIIILDTFIILSLASSNIVVTYHHFCRRTDGDRDTFVKDIIEDDKKETSFVFPKQFDMKDVKNEAMVINNCDDVIEHK